MTAEALAPPKSRVPFARFWPPVKQFWNRHVRKLLLSVSILAVSPLLSLGIELVKGKPASLFELGSLVGLALVALWTLSWRKASDWLLRFACRIVVSAVVGAPAGLIVAIALDKLTPMRVDGEDVVATMVITATLVFAYLYTAAWRRQSSLAAEIGLAVTDDVIVTGDGAVEQVIASLRLRARRLRFAARFTLLLMISALVLGSATFVGAGAQASRESDFTRMRLEYLDRTMYELQRRAELTESAAERRYLLNEIEAKRRERNQVIAQLSGTGAGQVDVTVYAISSLTTRIGSVFVLLFLVQILTALYRYNTRLAAFLEARADALQLTPRPELPLKDLVDLFAPDAVDYGKMPKPLNEQILQVTKNFADAVKGATARA